MRQGSWKMTPKACEADQKELSAGFWKMQTGRERHQATSHHVKNQKKRSRGRQKCAVTIPVTPLRAKSFFYSPEKESLDAEVEEPPAYMEIRLGS
jgi:hypothetical protein